MKNGELVYDSDGTTILYEEKQILDNVPLEVTLNELGKQDTEITIKVTAEDGVTEKEYKVTIKRPYGIIKGNVLVKPTESLGIHHATIRVYQTEKVNEIIDWNLINSDESDDVHDRLLTLESINVDSNDDGSYEIFVIPGKYDVLIDKPGYLDEIHVNKSVLAEQETDLGTNSLMPGDINKDGLVQIQDLTMLITIYGIDNTNASYDIKYDFNEDLQIQLQDLTILNTYYSSVRKIYRDLNN